MKNSAIYSRHLLLTAARLSTVLAGTLALGACSFLGGAQGHLKRAEKSLEAGNALVAKIEAKKSLAIDAKQPKAWLILAKADFLQNDSEAAEIALGKAKAAGATAAELAPLELKSLYVQGHYALMRVNISQNKTLSPAIKYRYEGLALLGLHRPADALKNFNKALVANPADIESAVGKSLALRLLDQAPEAATFLKNLKDEHPGVARYALALANIDISLNNLPGAERNYRLAGSLTSPQKDLPTWILAQAGYAQSAIVQGRWQDAKKAIHILNHGVPGLLLTKLLAARVALGEGHLPEAATAAQTVASALPADVQAHMLLAYATYRQGYPQEAETSLDEVLTAHPDYSPARKLLATIQLQEGRLGAAYNTLSPLLADNPGPNTLILAGRIDEANRNNGAAEADFTKALASPQATNEMRYDVAVYELKAGDKQKALDLLKALPSGTTVGKKRDLLMALLAGTDGHGTAANKALAKVAAKYSSDIVLQRTVAELYASHGDLKDARAELNTILAAHPRDIESMIGIARLDALSGDDVSAVKRLNAALNIDPNNVSVLMTLAEIAAQQKHTTQEIDYLNRAAKADASALAPRLALVRIYLLEHLKNPSDAQVLTEASTPMQEALSIAPHDLAVSLIDSQYEYQSGHVHKAKEVLKNAVTSNPDTTPVLLTLASLQIKTGEASKAYDTLNEALSRNPGWLPAVRELAALYTDNDNYTEALAVAHKAQTVPTLHGAQAAQQKAGALYIQGEVYATEAARSAADAQSLYAKASELFSSAYTAYPTFTTAVRVFQTRKAAGLDDPQGTLVAYASTHPMDIEALNTLSNYYLAKKEDAKAAAVYTKAIAQGAATSAHYNNLAWLYYVTHNPLALPTARKAVSLANGQPQILDTLGWILAHSGKLTEALTYIKPAYQHAPGNYDIGYHYAWTLAHSGHKARALAVLKKILSTDVNFASRGKAEALEQNIS